MFHSPTNWLTDLLTDLLTDWPNEWIELNWSDMILENGPPQILHHLWIKLFIYHTVCLGIAPLLASLTSSGASVHFLRSWIFRRQDFIQRRNLYSCEHTLLHQKKGRHAQKQFLRFEIFSWRLISKITQTPAETSLKRKCKSFTQPNHRHQAMLTLKWKCIRPVVLRQAVTYIYGISIAHFCNFPNRVLCFLSFKTVTVCNEYDLTVVQDDFWIPCGLMECINYLL